MGPADSAPAMFVRRLPVSASWSAGPPWNSDAEIRNRLAWSPLPGSLSLVSNLDQGFSANHFGGRHENRGAPLGGRG
jgi:hypothetical protein